MFLSFPCAIFSIKFCYSLCRKVFLICVRECPATKIVGEPLKRFDFHDDLLIYFCSEHFTGITSHKCSFWRKSGQYNKQSKLGLMPGLLKHLSEDMNCCEVWLYERCLSLFLSEILPWLSKYVRIFWFLKQGLAVLNYDLQETV